jgi:hypothetical protein
MGLACSAYGGGETHIQGFGAETRGKETTGGDPGIDGRIILRWMFRKWGQDWIDLAQIGTGFWLSYKR